MIAVVSGGQKVFEGVTVVIMIMEAVLILSIVEIQNVLKEWSWVLDFNLSELRDWLSFGRPVELQGKKFCKKAMLYVLKTKYLNVLLSNFVFHYLTAFLILVQLGLKVSVFSG